MSNAGRAMAGLGVGRYAVGRPVAGRVTSQRLWRDGLLIVTGLLLLAGLADLTRLVPLVFGQDGGFGSDFHLYQGAARSWLAGDGFYHARQLGGPYAIEAGGPTYSGDILYPPTILWLLLPFTILPEFLWWAAPAATIGFAIWRMRPARWTWPLMALGLAWPHTTMLILRGNPSMWVAAAVAGGSLWRWPAAFVLLKPSLAPFALLGARDRRWWLTVTAMALATVPLLPLVAQYLRVVLDSDATLAYSALEVPLVALPLVARLGRSVEDVDVGPGRSGRRGSEVSSEAHVGGSEGRGGPA